MIPRAVIFDADGVVIHPQLRFAHYLAQTHDLTRAHTQEFFTGVFLSCLTGQADLRQVLPPYLAAWGWSASLDDFLKRWFEEEDTVDQRLLETIRELRARGLRCALATNQERYRLAYMRQQMGFADRFDAVFGSAEIGCLKDDPRFYRHIEMALDLPGEALLFWDDSAANIAQARASGWRAEVYQSYDDFRPLLDRYLAAE